MYRRNVFLMFLTVLFVVGIVSSGFAQHSLHRLGVPIGHVEPVYQMLIDALQNHGYAVGKNLEVVEVDLSEEHVLKYGAQHVRHELAEKADALFVTGNMLLPTFRLEPTIPLVFVGLQGMESGIPASIANNTTGVWRDSAVKIFEKMGEMFTGDTVRRIGIPARAGLLPVHALKNAAAECTNCKLEIVPIPLGAVEDIRPALMRAADNLDAIALFPPMVLDADLPVYKEIQMEKKIPILVQGEWLVRKGFVGGPVTDYAEITDTLAGYVDNIFHGISPAKMPQLQISSFFSINLRTARDIGMELSRDVVHRARIHGVALNRTLAYDAVQQPPKPGKYRIGLPKVLRPVLKNMIVDFLEAKGYKENVNLSIMDHENVILSHDKMPDVRDILLYTCYDNEEFSRINHTVPIVFIGNSENFSIPSHIKNQVTGVTKSSVHRIAGMLKEIMPKASRMAVIGHESEEFEKILAVFGSELQKIGIQDIPVRIERFKGFEQAADYAFSSADFVFAQSSAFTSNELLSIVAHQKQHKKPAFTQFEPDVLLGFAGGIITDFTEVIPKLTDYIDAVFQGVSPGKLVSYNFNPQYVLNLGVIRQIGVQVPRHVVRTAKIVR